MIAGLKCPPEMCPRFETHDPDRETIRESDGDDVLTADDARAAADEDQRERADELRDPTAKKVLIHGRRAYEGNRTTTDRRGVAIRAPGTDPS